MPFDIITLDLHQGVFGGLAQWNVTLAHYQFIWYLNKMDWSQYSESSENPMYSLWF